MALDAELSNLKSAGTYRFERDLSTISNDTTTYSNLRLVVGFSKVGPFNTPMLITNTAQFIKLYGNIDRSLEKKGSYFHRSALVALSAGPILALNLLNLDPDVDQVQQKSFAVNTKDTNKPVITLPLVSLYNTDKFWFPSEECYLDSIEKYLSSSSAQDILVGNSSDYTDKIIHFTNVGKKPVSILVKKASSYSTSGYECTLNEWYGESNVPEYLNGTSFVSDYFVEVYVVAGDFGPATVKSNGIPTGVDLDDDDVTEIIYRYDRVDKDNETNAYARFTSDITYQEYFDADGFIRREKITDTNDTKLAKFLNLPSVELIGKYTGSLIPNFTDKMGRNIWIQKLINDDTNSTGVLCVENVELLEDVDTDAERIDEKIDIIGHNIYSSMKKNTECGELNFLSYKTKYSPIEQSITIISTYDGDSDESNDNAKHVYKRITDLDELVNIYHDATGKTIDKGTLVGPEYAPYLWVCVGELHELATSGDGTRFLDYKVGDVPLNAFIYTAESSYPAGVATSKKYAYMMGANAKYETVPIYSIEDKNPLFTDIYCVSKGTPGADDEKKLYFNTSRGIEGISYDALHVTSKKDSDTITEKGNQVILPLTADIAAGDYLVSYYNGTEDDYDTLVKPYSRLTRVIEVRGVYAEIESSTKLTKVGLRAICSDTVCVGENNSIRKFKTVDQFADHFQWTCLKGYKIREDLMPNGTNDRQNEILDMLREEPEIPGTKSNLYKTLCDRDYIQWRYLVDTFGLGLEESCKDVYTKLCAGRQSAFALVNCPSQTDFKKSIDPSFVNDRGSVEVEYIAKGGNLIKTPAFLFSLPSQEDGASWGAYFYPYLKISDLSATKSVPPAAYVSNLYIAKYNSGRAWSIVAGQRRGVISGNQVIGVEATLIHDNRDWLEPVGINSIIWENGVGVEIYANKTAKQTPKSALSSAHVREACIYIQDNVESILRKYIFEMNTAQTRLEIKTLVDSFLETVKSDGGVYAYKTVMDTSNNTQDVIDNNMGVIDIYIEPVRGLEILTQRLTVMKTGGIASLGFDE